MKALRRLVPAAAVTAALVGLFLFALWCGGAGPWTAFDFLASVVVIEALSWVGALSGVSVSRVPSGQAFGGILRLSAGQNFAAEVTIVRRGIFPLWWIRVEEDIPNRWLLQARGLESGRVPLWRPMETVHYSVERLQRGLYHLGGTTLITGDLFGLLERRRTFPGMLTVIVHPAVVPVRGWAPARLSESAGTRYPAPAGSWDGPSGVRGYAPGDRPSHIHWPATAKRNLLQSKRFDYTVDHEVVLCLDVSASSYASAHASLFDLAVVIAASLAIHLIHGHRDFTLACGSRSVTPRQNAAAREIACLDELADVQPSDPIDFSERLAVWLNHLQPGATFVVVSPRTDLIPLVQRSTRKHHRVDWFQPNQEHPGEPRHRHALQRLDAAVSLISVASPDQLSRLESGWKHHARPG